MQPIVPRLDVFFRPDNAVDDHEIAEELGIKNDTFRKAINDGRLLEPRPTETALTKSSRNEEDVAAADVFSAELDEAIGRARLCGVGHAAGVGSRRGSRPLAQPGVGGAAGERGSKELPDEQQVAAKQARAEARGRDKGRAEAANACLIRTRHHSATKRSKVC